jgi:hypothetical protein
MRRARAIEGLRLTALVAVGALVLHQARYVVGHGDGAGEALARDGHAHVGLALPITLAIAAALVGITLMLAAFARPRRRRAGGPDPRRRALQCALVLLGCFCLQELGEGLLSDSHPDGFEALLGHGGAAALPLAVVLGCLVSLLVEALNGAERSLAGSLITPRLAPAKPQPFCYLEPEVERLCGLGLVFGFARRPPPSPTLVN